MTDAPEIVAHRGAPDATTPENTLQAFRRAAALGADAVELDVRLTCDGEPVVFHRAHLDAITSGSGPVFARTLAELRDIRYIGAAGVPLTDATIPTLREVVEAVGGRTGLEIELKGPEPETADTVARLLADWCHVWDTMEVTSFEPALLLAIRRSCPGLATDLLTPEPPPWMGLDVLLHQALHRGRLAGARAVHLHLSQLTHEAVTRIRAYGMDVHAWGINDAAAMAEARNLGIRKVCTDDVCASVSARTSMCNQ